MWNSNSNTLVPDHDLEPPDEAQSRIHQSRLEECKFCGEQKMKGKPCGHCNGECPVCGYFPVMKDEECENCHGDLGCMDRW